MWRPKKKTPKKDAKWYTDDMSGSQGSDSSSEESETEEACDIRDLERFLKELKKPSLAMFSGDRELYHDWRMQIDIFIHQMRVSPKIKMLMLKNSLSGKPLKVVENLGYTPKQYKTALKKLDQKYGGEKRLLQRYIETILQTTTIREENLRELEIFSDRLVDVVAKLKDYGHQRELMGVSTLYTAVQQKMPKSLLVSYREWRHSKHKGDGLATFVKWLAKQVIYRMDADEICERPRKREEKFHERKSPKASTHSTAADAKVKCPLCEGTHKITTCKTWKETPVKGRWEIAKKNKLCYRCLGPGHLGKACRGSNRCNVDNCGGTHHFHLHFERRERASEHNRNEEIATASSSFGATGNHLKIPESVMLRTVPVWLLGTRGQRIQVNAFLDDGSDTTYVRDDVATALGFCAEDGHLRVSTLTDRDIELRSRTVLLGIESLDGGTRATVHAWTMEEMCHGLPIPNWNRHKARWEHLKDIPFPKAPGRRTVDVLIGSDHPELSLALEERVGLLGEPIARRTPLGWTCVGRLPVMAHNQSTAYARTFRTQAIEETRLDQQLRQMWEIDALGLESQATDLFTPEERLAMTKAEESRKWKGDRYEVAIPWKAEVPPLPDNRAEAEKRLKSLEKSLLRRPRVAERYKEAMNANLDKGYVRKVHPDELDTRPGWYLPHFPVIREDKQTTKVRIVFDSAARCKGVCLNDAMLTGPKLQKDVLETLLRFRLKPVALVADIKEMFSQVVLAEKDRPYHRFLWRELDLSKPPEVYEASRLTFGDRASPYLAQFIIRTHAEEHQDEYPLGAAVILLKMYMDDVLDSEETEDEAIKVREELTTLLAPAGFQIRRWCSNKANVLRGIPEEDLANGLKIEESELPSIKTLGVGWNAARDMFLFTINGIESFSYTKRGLLSRIATLFDPVQFLAPYVIRAKMALQESWLRGLDWDEEFPEDLRASVQRWIEQLPRVAEIRIPRCYRTERPVRDVSLHTFVDASKRAYAAVTYFRHEYEDGGTTVSLVAAKARVTPTKSVSIPRLELMAAVLGLRLAATVSETLGCPLDQHTFWTDSMDVVFWVQGHSRRYKPFVAHRVSEIQQKTDPKQWRHVPGKDNSADDATRGLNAEELTAESRWFQGPAFLQEGEESWPPPHHTTVQDCTEEAESELTAATLSFHVGRVELWLDPETVPSWTKLLRVTAWVLRFLSKIRSSVKERRNQTSNTDQEPGCQPSNIGRALDPDEVKAAEQYWIQQTQLERFPREVEDLQKGKTVSKQSRLKKLTPFLDQDGIMRIGGRLQKSNLPYDAQHPVILPRKHRISKLIIAHIHKNGRHSRGVNCILAELRQKYWITHGREEVKRWERECNLCKIRRKGRGEQIMAPLPEARLGTPMRCFARCCVDFAGPFTTKVTRRVSAKRYLCLFSCTATRAVHLEMAYSLDTSSFLNAFSRMVARRGKPEEMVSDNGTNFVSGNRELRELVDALDQDEIKDKAATDGIRWKFNPPAGSHHGGVFEALIKSAKRALGAILGDAGVNDEELLTAIAETEGLMNSRPLTYCSNDPHDEPVLTPNHFLYGQAGGQLAPRVTDEIAFNPRNRWRFVQDLVVKVWKRWMKEYLSTLNTRGKWVEQRRDMAVGDVVLMVDQNSLRRSWPLGRVLKVFPGSDGHVRVVRVKSRGREYTRPITKLCPLEF